MNRCLPFCRFLLTAAAVGTFSGCGSESGPVSDADVKDVASGDVDVIDSFVDTPADGADSAETAADVFVPPPVDWCPPSDAVDIDSGILPKPVRVAGWAGKVTFLNAVPSVQIVGNDDSAEVAFSRMKTDFGFVDAESPRKATILIVIHPDTEWQTVVESCDFSLPDSPEAYVVRVDADDAGKAVVNIVAPSAEGRANAYRTVRQLFGTAGRTTASLAVVDAPAARYRGIIETFYGSPYEEEDRLALLPYLADMKFNQYIYAGKMDLYTDWIGTYWPQEWPAEYTGMLATMAAAIKKAGMKPGVQLRIEHRIMVFSSDAEFDLFMEKIRLFHDLGFELFSLSFDDTQKVLLDEDTAVYASYDEAIVDFSKRAFEAIHAEMPDMMLGWVPADYYSNAPDAAVSLPLAGDNIPSYVSIGWTGREVAPPTITAQDADQMAAWIKRKPLLGDNYPVIDRASARLFLGPLPGRAPDLIDHLDGILFNPMPLPFQSLPALATCADYAWNPGVYEPERSMSDMARFLAGNTDAAVALMVLADVNRSDWFLESMCPELKADLADLLARAETESPLNTSAVMNRWFTPFKAAHGQWLRPSESPVPSDRLVNGLMPWMDQLVRYGNLGEESLVILEKLSQGQEIDQQGIEAFKAGVEEARTYEKRPTGNIMQEFLDNVAARL